MSTSETIKFLLVDDVEENLLALEALLKRDGLELFKAYSGRQALEMLLVNEFALAICDVQMPGMDGFELAELMRSSERTRNVPIIFLTAVATDERRRFRGYEAGAVDYLFKPVDPQTLLSKTAVFYELARQRHELARQRDELRQSAERLSRALNLLKAHSDNSPLAIIELDPSFRLSSWSKSAERMFGWGAQHVLGKHVGDLGWLDADDVTRLTEMTMVILSGGQSDVVLPCRSCCKDGKHIECEWYISVLPDASGNLCSVSAQILDVTERKRHEATRQLLIGELNHRVKNTLATVQAIATQTLRHAERPDEFAESFSGRLQSLAKAHSLLSDTEWKGASLSELVRGQESLAAVDGERLTTSGPNIELPPQLALHLGLILHELTTNAQKHGALATVDGHIELAWGVEEGALKLKWVENCNQEIRAPTRRGFGSTLIERSVSAERGAAEVSYRRNGVTWDLSFALTEEKAYAMNRRAKV